MNPELECSASARLIPALGSLTLNQLRRCHVLFKWVAVHNHRRRRRRFLFQLTSWFLMEIHGYHLLSADDSICCHRLSIWGRRNCKLERLQWHWKSSGIAKDADNGSCGFTITTRCVNPRCRRWSGYATLSAMYQFNASNFSMQSWASSYIKIRV